MFNRVELCPTRKPEKLKNEWACTHSKAGKLENEWAYTLIPLHTYTPAHSGTPHIHTSHLYSHIHTSTPTRPICLSPKKSVKLYT